MGYTHYGRIGDIWKHLPLCNFLVNEKPRWYIETNSARPCYPLTRSTERDYGIYTILDNASESDVIMNSVFYKTLTNHGGKGAIPREYLGSPGLAMNVLRDNAEKYIFCDIEEEPLDAIRDYAVRIGLSNRVRTYKNDSIKTIDFLRNNLSPSDFIHIDPYSISEKNAEEKTFFDTFLDSVAGGMKSMLWYGFDTNGQRRELVNWMKAKAKSSFIRPGNKVIAIELYLSSIRENEVIVNPGVVGCGIAIGNLSQRSIHEFDGLADELVKIYQNSMIPGGHEGRLEKRRYFL